MIWTPTLALIPTLTLTLNLTSTLALTLIGSRHGNSRPRLFPESDPDQDSDQSLDSTLGRGQGQSESTSRSRSRSCSESGSESKYGVGYESESNFSQSSGLDLSLDYIPADTVLITPDLRSGQVLKLDLDAYGTSLAAKTAERLVPTAFCPYQYTTTAFQ